ncbi:MAG: P1 family peptidase [Ignavibacteriales bacterium]|nr:P1 family peptidase [Ignavibacteriales bacterium]
MITRVPGFKVGNVTDSVNATGCTVILCPPRTRASCEVRGNSPGSRELALLAPEKSMQEVHALLLTGGSAFGLAAADGVVQWLQENDVGYETPWAKVPIVPAAVVFDLNVGSKTVRPTAASGYEACRIASQQFAEGSVGAGTGATVGKWAGVETWMKGGIGSASERIGDLIVGTLAVVNAVGDIIDEHGNIIAGARGKNRRFLAEENPLRTFARGKVLEKANTTLVVMATNADLGKLELFRVSQRMHDGMARAVAPVHTSYDGDVAFAFSAGKQETDFDFIAELSAQLTASAIRRAVRSATEVDGVPAIASA